MTNVLIFQHRGLTTALPAGQVVSVASENQRGAEVVHLWPGTSDDDRLALRVRSAQGEVAISCGTARLERVPYTSLLGLSPLLRASLHSMPYVVGATWLHDTHLWLVDMSRYHGTGPARIAAPSARRDDE
jgi:hypothetical protein